MPDPAPIDHDCLKKVANVLGQTCPFGLSRLKDVAHVPGSVRFTDREDKKRYEIVVREVLPGGDGESQPTDLHPV